MIYFLSNLVKFKNNYPFQIITYVTACFITYKVYKIADLQWIYLVVSYCCHFCIHEEDCRPKRWRSWWELNEHWWEIIDIQNEFHLFSEEFQLFLDEGFDVKAHANKAIQGKAISEQLSKLAEGISLLDKEIHSQVRRRESLNNVYHAEDQWCLSWV